MPRVGKPGVAKGREAEALPGQPLNGAVRGCTGCTLNSLAVLSRRDGDPTGRRSNAKERRKEGMLLFGGRRVRLF